MKGTRNVKSCWKGNGAQCWALRGWTKDSECVVAVITEPTVQSNSLASWVGTAGVLSGSLLEALMKLLFLERDLENDSEVADFNAADFRWGSCCCGFGIRIPSRSGCVAGYWKTGELDCSRGCEWGLRRSGRIKRKTEIDFHSSFFWEFQMSAQKAITSLKNSSSPALCVWFLSSSSGVSFKKTRWLRQPEKPLPIGFQKELRSNLKFPLPDVTFLIPARPFPTTLFCGPLYGFSFHLLFRVRRAITREGAMNSPNSLPTSPSLPWRFSSSLIMGLTGSLSRGFLYGLNYMEVVGLERFLETLDKRKDVESRKRGLITGTRLVDVFIDLRPCADCLVFEQYQIMSACMPNVCANTLRYNIDIVFTEWMTLWFGASFLFATLSIPRIIDGV